ncbi:MAG: hypothetical protein ACK4E3_08720 [Brevundimonas sp.]|uniref:protein-tyrosine phosphatase family protein n=1 Tax=Brevundimonas sp. TaxID=1871086 RepID=UPI00391B05B1
MRIFWIKTDGPGRLGITPRPDGGDDLETEIIDWRDDGVDVVVSMLETAEAEALGLAREAELCARHGIIFANVPVRDHDIPVDLPHYREVAQALASRMAAGEKIVIHCRAALGRAPSLAACVLIERGMSAGRALEIVGKARKHRVPETDAQTAFVWAYGSGQLFDAALSA